MNGPMITFYKIAKNIAVKKQSNKIQAEGEKESPIRIRRMCHCQHKETPVSWEWRTLLGSSSRNPLQVFL